VLLDKPRISPGEDRFAIAFRREKLAFGRGNIVLAMQNDVFPDGILIETA
jgi:hypothetical protein